MTGKKKKRKRRPFPHYSFVVASEPAAQLGSARLSLGVAPITICPPQACFPCWKTGQISSVRKQLYLGKKNTGKTKGRRRGHGSGGDGPSQKNKTQKQNCVGLVPSAICFGFPALSSCLANVIETEVHVLLF